MADVPHPGWPSPEGAWRPSLAAPERSDWPVDRHIQSHIVRGMLADSKHVVFGSASLFLQATWNRRMPFQWIHLGWVDRIGYISRQSSSDRVLQHFVALYFAVSLGLFATSGGRKV